MSQSPVVTFGSGICQQQHAKPPPMHVSDPPLYVITNIKKGRKGKHRAHQRIYIDMYLHIPGCPKARTMAAFDGGFPCLKRKENYIAETQITVET